MKKHTLVITIGVTFLVGMVIFCAYSFGLFDALFVKPPAEVPVVETPVEEVPVFATALNANDAGVYEVAVGTSDYFVFTTSGVAHNSADYSVTIADEAIATATLMPENATTNGESCGFISVTGIAVGDTQMKITRADGKAVLEVTVRIYDPSYTLDADGNVQFTTEPVGGGTAIGGTPSGGTNGNAPGVSNLPPSDDPGGVDGHCDGSHDGTTEPGISFG